jgi:pyruvate/2-oxoglutarate dehydrogenase complex dihydrolipoamide dehydrogenase (E3) component
MSEFDYDLIIIGAGVGGHGAALTRSQMWAKNSYY